MKYPKEIMTIKELVNMGWSESELLAIYRRRNNGIAWKNGNYKNSTIMFSTQDLERYRKNKCTGT